MIVTATRRDLRDEISMADEAFALSPISARATLPSEADYDAISEAFMETSRGRWFLSEYAKRNRNADTRMVLDAVARIETSLATQKQPASDDRLAEALATFRSAVDDARVAALDALDGLAVEEALTPIRNGAQVIRETLLRLREIGADGRIYDLMDSQVSAIEAGYGQLVASGSRASLGAAFDLIEARIAQFEGGDATPQSLEPEIASPSPVPAREEASAEAVASGAAVSASETALDDALDLVALEMGAPDFSNEYLAEPYVAELASAEPEIVIPASEPVIASEPRLPPANQPSLGASLIASGIVRSPNMSGSDPLAAIRRMSQAEKIAFFS